MSKPNSFRELCENLSEEDSSPLGSHSPDFQSLNSCRSPPVETAHAMSEPSNLFHTDVKTCTKAGDPKKQQQSSNASASTEEKLNLASDSRIPSNKEKSKLLFPDSFERQELNPLNYDDIKLKQGSNNNNNPTKSERNLNIRKNIFDSIPNNFLNKQAEMNKLLSNSKSGMLENGSFNDINGFINRVNHMNGANNFNNISSFLASGLVHPKDIPFYLNSAVLNSPAMASFTSSSTVTNGSGSLSASMMTLSPPHTLSPHNRSNNMSLSSSSASPHGDDDGAEADDDEEEEEREPIPLKRKKIDSEFSPSNMRTYLQNQATPPLTPINNNNIVHTKNDRPDKNIWSPTIMPNRSTLASQISAMPYFNSHMSTAASMALLSQTKTSSLFTNGITDFRYRHAFEKPDVLNHNNFSSDGKGFQHSLKDGDVKFSNFSTSSANFTSESPPSSFKSHFASGNIRHATSASNLKSSQLDLNAATQRFITHQLSATPAELQLRETTVPRENKKSVNPTVKTEDSKAYPSTLSDSFANPTIKTENLRDWDELQNPNHSKLGVFAKHSIQKGTRYGPFLGKWTTFVGDPAFAWEVSEVPNTSNLIVIISIDVHHNSWLKIII